MIFKISNKNVWLLHNANAYRVTMAVVEGFADSVDVQGAVAASCISWIHGALKIGQKSI